MCEVDFGGEYSTLLSEEVGRSRKEHQCTECRTRISSGEFYTRRSSVCNGSLSVQKLCAHCAKDEKEFAEAHGVGWFGGGWLDFLSDCIVGDGEDADPRWVAMLERARVRGKRARDG